MARSSHIEGMKRACYRISAFSVPPRWFFQLDGGRDIRDVIVGSSSVQSLQHWPILRSGMAYDTGGLAAFLEVGHQGIGEAVI